jgi:hypothetical protein
MPVLQCFGLAVSCAYIIAHQSVVLRMYCEKFGHGGGVSIRRHDEKPWPEHRSEVLEDRVRAESIKTGTNCLTAAMSGKAAYGPRMWLTDNLDLNAVRKSGCVA